MLAQAPNTRAQPTSATFRSITCAPLRSDFSQVYPMV